MFALFFWEADEVGGGWNDFKGKYATIREAERAMRDVFVSARNTNQTRLSRYQARMKAQIIDLESVQCVFDSEEHNPWALRLETRTPGGDWAVFAIGPSDLLNKPTRQPAWEWFAANCPTAQFGPQTESRVAAITDPDNFDYTVRRGPFTSAR